MSPADVSAGAGVAGVSPCEGSWNASSSRGRSRPIRCPRMGAVGDHHVGRGRDEDPVSRVVGDDALLHPQARAVEHAHAVAGGSRQGHDHEVAQRDRHAGRCGSTMAGPPVATTLPTAPGTARIDTDLVTLTGRGVVVRRVEHPDLAAVGHGGERGGQQPARLRQRARIGVVAVGGARRRGRSGHGLQPGRSRVAESASAAHTRLRADMVGLPWVMG